MNTDAHVYHETGPAVINAPIERFLIENMLQEAYDLVTRASQWPDEGKLEIETRLSNATRQCCHIFKAMEGVTIMFVAWS